MNKYNFNHLYYFYITAKLDGITSAAKYLNTSQSSLSVQIKNLEYTIGADLFKKVGRKIEITETGKELYQFCRRAFETFDEMNDHLQKSKSSMGLRIHIGVSNDMDRPFIADIIGKVIKQYPRSRQPLVKLTSLDSEGVLDLLKTGQLDFVIGTTASLDGGIKLHEEITLPVFAYGSKEIRIDLKSGELVEIFKNSDWGVVLPSKFTLLRSEADEFFIKKKFWPTITFESNIFASVVRAAVDGLGIAILPHAYVSREVKSEKLFLLNEVSLWKHRIFVLSLKDKLVGEKSQIMDQIRAEINKATQHEKFKRK